MVQLKFCRPALTRLVVCVLLLAVSAGCNTKDQIPTAQVEGRVLYNNNPLEFGTVTFQPENGPLARGAINADGTFHLSTFEDGDGAVLGTHLAQITCYEAQRPDADPVGLPVAGEPDIGKSLIPDKYTQFYNSGLKYEVGKDGFKDLEIILE